MRQVGAGPQFVAGIGRTPKAGFWDARHSMESARLQATQGLGFATEYPSAFAAFNSSTTPWTLGNSASIGSTNAYTDGGYTNALQIASATMYAEIASNLVIGSTTPFFISLFVRTNLALSTGAQYYVLHLEDGSGNGYALAHQSSGNFQMFNTNGGVPNVSTGATTLTQNQWDHVAINRDSSGNMGFWVRGASVDTDTSNTDTICGTAGNVRVGRATNGITGQACGLVVIAGASIVPYNAATIPVPAQPNLFLI